MSDSDLHGWAKASRDKSRVHRHQCQTCNDYSEACKVIEQFVAAQDAGDPDFKDLVVASTTRPSLLTFLVENYDYRLGESALRRHVQRCVRDAKGQA